MDALFDFRNGNLTPERAKLCPNPEIDIESTSLLRAEVPHSRQNRPGALSQDPLHQSPVDRPSDVVFANSDTNPNSGSLTGGQCTDGYEILCQPQLPGTFPKDSSEIVATDNSRGPWEPQGALMSGIARHAQILE